MNNTSFFDINRLKHLLIRQASFNSKILLIATGAIMGVVMFIGTMMLVFSNQTIRDQVFLGLVMPYFFIGGYVFTSVIFSELNSSHRGYMYLMLPATAFEKLSAAWLLSSIGYLLFSTVALYIMNFYFITISAFTSKTVSVLNIFDADVLKMFAVYLVTQSVFFLGAIYFRKVNFLKTLLALFVIAVAVAFYTGTFTRIVFFSSDGFMNNIMNSRGGEHVAEDIIVPVAKTFFWFIMAPFFLLVSYFRLKEREV